MNVRKSIPPPPRRFRPAGLVRKAELATDVPHFARGTRRSSGAKARGTRYETRVQEDFDTRYGCHYLPSPWIYFCEARDGASRWRWCQPDGVLILPLSRLIVVVEIKISHTSDAWWQIRQLYQPVLSALFPPELWRYAACEVCKWYDPAVPFPERLRKTPDPTLLEPGEFGVHISKQ